MRSLLLLVCALFSSTATAAPQQDFINFNALADVNNPLLVVQARPASVAVDRQGAAATNVPVVVAAPDGSEYCGIGSCGNGAALLLVVRALCHDNADA